MVRRLCNNCGSDMHQGRDKYWHCKFCNGTPYSDEELAVIWEEARERGEIR